MKLKIYIITALFILLTATFSQSVFAQNQSVLNKEQSVKQFVMSFVKSFEETKDISKVPDSFFTADYRRRFADTRDSGDIMNMYGISDKFYAKLSRKQRYEYLVLRFNFNVLPFMFIKKPEVSQEAELTKETSKSKDKLDVASWLFPPEIFQHFKQTKIFSQSVDNDFEITKLAEFNQLVSEMRAILQEFRTYLTKNNLPDSESMLAVEMQEMITDADWEKSEEFCGKYKEECSGLPKNTRYIYIGGFLLRLTIIKQKGKFKIFDTPVWEDASSRFTYGSIQKK
jgi:hypothetical protein